MVAKFTETVILREPGTQATVAFFDGDVVPEWAADQVGPHVTASDTRAPAKKAAASKSEK